MPTISSNTILIFNEAIPQSSSLFLRWTSSVSVSLIELPSLEHIRKEEGREGRAKVALIARRLAAVAKEVESMDKGEETRQAVEKYCERFENDMLKLFDRYYRKSDPKGMAVSWVCFLQAA